MYLVMACADIYLHVRLSMTKVAGALFLDVDSQSASGAKCILNMQIDIAGRVVERVPGLIWNRKSEAAHVGL